MTNKLISSCCKAKLWLCGASRKYPKLDANDPDNWKKSEAGRTCYYECDKCKQECDAIGETLDIKTSEWIKCSEKLPEKPIPVLIYHLGDVSSATYIRSERKGNYWAKEDRLYNSEPTHWQPLPEPPKDNE